MGDSLYGTEEGKAKSDRLLLHARVLSFNHVRPLNNRKGGRKCLVLETGATLWAYSCQYLIIW